MKYLDVVCIERAVGGDQRERFQLRHRDEQPVERIAMMVRKLCDAAGVVVLDRQRNRHIAFGIGIHRCAGSNLARMEMDVALRVWFERLPEFELADPDTVTWAGGQVRGPRSIPVTFPV